LPFKRNLQRYNEAAERAAAEEAERRKVGLCTLNRVDP
jgi:hypothetical protein